MKLYFNNNKVLISLAIIQKKNYFLTFKVLQIFMFRRKCYSIGESLKQIKYILLNTLLVVLYTNRIRYNFVVGYVKIDSFNGFFVH